MSFTKISIAVLWCHQVISKYVMLEITSYSESEVRDSCPNCDLLISSANQTSASCLFPRVICKVQTRTLKGQLFTVNKDFMEHKLLTLSPPRDQKPYRLISSQLLFFCRVCGSCSFHSFKRNLCTLRFTAWEAFSLTQLSWARSFLPASSGKIDPWSAQSRIPKHISRRTNCPLKIIMLKNIYKLHSYTTCI